jgi:hypothetical protein
MLFRVFSSSILLAGLVYYTAAVSIVSQTDLQNPETPYTNATCRSDYNWVRDSSQILRLLVVFMSSFIGGELEEAESLFGTFGLSRIHKQRLIGSAI